MRGHTLNLRRLRACLSAFVCFAGAVGVVSSLTAADEVIPHAQDRPPGPAVSPQEAINRMALPEGFTLERVASEPQIVNPVAMCFDERGRIWITESLEYPRNEPGPGRDRIKILEDTDGDGQADKFTVFAEGLNIPSGIAVGHGGVWVSNPPDILFLRDTDGDGRADTREVVVTGFGRQDTHEMPNSLTWGPDGYLYGTVGVFNHNVVKQGDRVYDFAGGVWRIDPRTRKFELFAQGLSNPWGIAFDENGEMFVSACVIDHLWHITRSGYYTRQAGPYPPHTWPMGSIVDHKHQKAAYCGIVWFDSEAYPPAYRGKLYMGNIHGNCINADALQRDGSTYRGVAGPDLLGSGGDVWFMPVSQKVGPDGCLYILDWYDRYHCYQDARRDPTGIDRLKGRLYRLRYNDPQRAATVRERSEGSARQGPLPHGRGSYPTFDLGRLADDQLLVKLGDANVFIRQTAQRLLSERNNPQTRPKLQSLVREGSAPRKQRLHALWALISAGRLNEDFHLQLLRHEDPTFRAWAVRAAGDCGHLAPQIRDPIAGLATDPSPDVRLQIAIAARAIEGDDPFNLLTAVVNHSGDDRLIPNIVWQNLYPSLATRGDLFVNTVIPRLEKSPAADAVLSRSVDLLASSPQVPPETMARLVQVLAAQSRPQMVDRCLAALADQTHNGQINPQRLGALKASLMPVLEKSQGSSAVILAATWGRSQAVTAVKALLQDPQTPEADRLRAMRALIAIDDPQALDLAAAQLRGGGAGVDYRRAVIASLGRLQSGPLPAELLRLYPGLDPALRPAIIELLIQRPAGVAALLDAIEKNRLSKNALNLNQVRGLVSSADPAMSRRAEAIWGKVRAERNPGREKVIAQTQKLLSQTRGDAGKGREVFARVCAQCHSIYGQGQNIGPDLTGNGRGSFEQLLSNVLDPSLVIGEAYQLRTVTMKDGRVLSGMIAEQSGQRVVLKVLGGQEQVLPSDQVQQIATLPVSFMPEGLEQTLTPQELVDLFAFLALDHPPGDPQARPIPGAPMPR